MKKKKVVYNVQCAYNPDHVFEKAFVIKEGSEHLESEMQARCPFCWKMVTITIKGKVVPDENILRGNG